MNRDLWNRRGWFWTTGQFVEEHDIESQLDIVSTYSPRFLYTGLAVAAGGVLLATIWSDVTDTGLVSLSMTPDGGVRASKSFGW